MADSKWEKLIKKWRDGDVPTQIDELPRVLKRWEPVCIVITAAGIATMCSTGNNRIIALGLFLAITGMASIVLMKTWALITLSMLRVVRELQEQKTAHLG